MSDDLVINVGKASISGWENIAVTLHAEAFPNQFQISFSTVDPVTNISTVAKNGDPCQVMIGEDLVITGYIDRDNTSGNPEGHMLSLLGRGKTQDLVDCSAELGDGVIVNATALEIAQKLAAPYGIAVRLADDVDVGPRIDQILVNYGETGADIIQRVARNAGLLAYEASDGALILGRAGTTVAASGAVYGQNVEAYSAENAMDGRMSDIVCVSYGQDLLADVTPLADKSQFFNTETDPNVPRHRLIYLVMEQAQDPEAFTTRKAQWEIARRAGRATSVNVTVDSWRDSAGKLWMPNTLIPVKVPGSRAADANLCISSVTFKRDNKSGTTADLTLLPAAAFLPEPINLVPVTVAGVVGVDGKQ